MGIRELLLTVLVDNEPYLPGLEQDWGFSAHLEAIGGPRLLMDTGGTARKLFNNAGALGVDLADLDAIFISHWHGDHCGALPELLRATGRGLRVFAPRRPGWLTTRELLRAGAELIEAREPRELLPGFYSTGDMGGEHALVADVDGLGLVVITGCSHPGPARMVRRALSVFGRRVYGLIGGLHISSYHEGLELGRELSSLGLELVCPCHCTGSRAKRGLLEAFSGSFLQCGTGRKLRFTGEGFSEAGG